MKPFTKHDCRAALLPIDNIDTDRITPARYLTTTSKEGLGSGLFADWPPGREAIRKADLLVAGHNFGCGSSREHAVWALLDAGIQVVVSTAFADIFHANALRNGLVAIALDPADHRKLAAELETAPSTPVRVDLEAQKIRCGSAEMTFDFDPFARHRIMLGLDELGFLLQQIPAIEAFENERTPRVDTREERE